MRERRQRLREQGVLQASSEESVEDLSIDTSVSSHCDLDRISGGIGRVSAYSSLHSTLGWAFTSLGAIVSSLSPTPTVTSLIGF